MQKLILSLFVIVSLLYTSCFAQGKTCTKGHCLKGDVGYVSFSAGPSIPIGDFSDNNVKNTNSGYAISGSKMELNAGLRLVKAVSLGAKLFYSINGYDASTLKGKLEIENPGTIWKASGRSWDIYGGMIGLSYSFPLTKKLASDVKFLSGIMQSSIPQMTITGSDGSTITEDKKSSTSFVYMISAGGHYPIGRLIDLIGNIEYLSSTPTFDIVNKVSNASGITTNTTTSSYKQNIGLLSFNLGFRVKF
jgi:hypothetical protein